MRKVLLILATAALLIMIMTGCAQKGTKQVIHTDNAPAAIGPYSQATVYGDTIYVSGQIPIDPATGEVIEGDVKAQTEQCLKNLSAILEAAGGSMDDVLKTTVYLKDINDFADMNEVYATFFKEGSYPARCAVEVANIPKGVAVEIDVIAVKH